MHHLSENQIIYFFKKFLDSQSNFLLISDLKRSFGGWLIAWIVTRLLSTSAIVHADGPQSVRAALTISEVSELAKHAGLKTARIQSVWPLRYLLSYDIIRAVDSFSLLEGEGQDEGGKQISLTLPSPKGRGENSNIL